MIVDVILRVSNVDRRCAISYLVTDAQGCPFDHVWIDVGVCEGRARAS